MRREANKTSISRFPIWATDDGCRHCVGSLSSILFNALLRRALPFSAVPLMSDRGSQLANERRKQRT